MRDVRVVLPGDVIIETPQTESDRICLGPGIRFTDGVIRATKPGMLKTDGRKLYYVDTHQKRYVPQKREFVVGTVIRCKGNTYLVDIGSHEPATLSYLAFENASKKTRTEMKLGDLIYGQLLVANKDMEPELVCIDFYNQSAGMGVLPEGGLVFTVSLNVARSIVQPENPFLMELAHVISFEMLIGFNGRIWLKAKSQIEMVALMHAVSMLECMDVSEAMRDVQSVVRSVLSSGSQIS